MFLNNSLGLKITGSIWAWWTTELRMTWVTHPILNTNHPVTCYEKPQGGLMRFYLFVRCFFVWMFAYISFAYCTVQATRLVEPCCWDANRLPGHSWSPRVPLMFTMPRWPVETCISAMKSAKHVAVPWVKILFLFLLWLFFCSPGAYFLVQAMNHICSEQNIAPEFWKYMYYIEDMFW